MKNTLFQVIIMTLLFGACKNEGSKTDTNTNETEVPTLSQAELTLIDSLSFDQVLVEKIKKYTKAHVSTWNINDSAFGLKVKMINSEGIVLMKDQENFLEQGYYMLFLADPTLQDVTVGLTREKNIHRILFATGTLATSDFPANAARELADKVQSWNRQGTLLIYGAGKDWLKLKIVSPRKDQVEMSQYIAQKCPDMANYYGGADGIRKNMDSTGIVDFWWE